MKNKYIFLITSFLALLTTIVLGFASSLSYKPEKVFLSNDPFNPLAQVLKETLEVEPTVLNPYILGQQSAGLRGLTFIYESQAQSFTKESNHSSFIPLFNTTIVLAINQDFMEKDQIKGWQSLIDSPAKVLFPHNGTESGRLAAIAMAKGLGAKDGDLVPALQALVYLQKEGRLNSREIYNSPNFNYSYDPALIESYHGVIMWDYQASSLMKIQKNKWQIVYPEEGLFTVGGGFLSNNQINSAGFKDLTLNLTTQETLTALEKAGFKPYFPNPNLDSWNKARLLFNPSYRREVLSVRVHATASVLERLIIKSLVFLIFVVVAQTIQRHTPKNEARSFNLHIMYFIALWLVLGIGKALALNPGSGRYLLLITYIPRHFLPVFWYFMCFSYRFSATPPKSHVTFFVLGAALLSLFVLTNDLHQQVFTYQFSDKSTWTDDYSNNWGVFLSMIWSFLPAAAGVYHILRGKNILKRKRQAFYGALFFTFLLAYQIAYIAGIVTITELDIPNTVAIFFLVFFLAAQKERFLGAALLNRPVFHNSPKGIEIFNNFKETVFLNKTMTEFQKAKPKFYQVKEYPVTGGTARLYEDLTELKNFESALEQSKERLLIAKSILSKQAEDTGQTESALEQEAFTSKMEELFYSKIEDLILYLEEQIKEPNLSLQQLIRLRFLLSICQQRLRFILSIPKRTQVLPINLIGKYTDNLLNAGSVLGLDGVLINQTKFDVAAGEATEILNQIDELCLKTLDIEGSSLILRFTVQKQNLVLIGLISQEGHKEIRLRRIFAVGGENNDFV